jgi:hypothetical protein
MDLGLVTVLPKLDNRELRLLADAWLRGRPLAPAQLEKLGLPSDAGDDEDQEHQARSVVLSLLQLAGDRTTTFICLDQIETVQASANDPVALRRVATLGTDLLSDLTPKVVATFVRPNTLVAMQTAVEVSDVQKLSQFQTGIPALSWDQTLKIVHARLEAEPTCLPHRRLRPDEPDYPLSRGFLEELFAQHKRSLTPRLLITQCRVEFSRIVEGGEIEDQRGDEDRIGGGTRVPQGTASAAQTGGDKEPSTTVLPVEFMRAWEAQRRKYLSSLAGVNFETVMGVGLPWLVELLNTRFVRVQDPIPQLGNVNLIFHPVHSTAKLLGVSFCHQEPRVLYHRLKKLTSQWQSEHGKRLGSLVILRAPEQPMAPGGEAKLEELRQLGACDVQLSREQLAEMAAFQILLTKALGGDLHRHGLTVEATTYQGWVKENVSSSVKEFLHQIFGDPFGTSPNGAIRERHSSSPIPDTAPVKQPRKSSADV